MDKLIKQTYFLLYKKASDTEELAYIYIRIIASNHRLLKEIISDRGMIFIFKFWQRLILYLGTNHKLSTVYYP